MSTKFVRLCEVCECVLVWLWRGLIAFGGTTILSGDPGTNKSLLTVNIAARLSRGLPMPLSVEPVEAGGIIYLNAEDSAAEIRKRFIAAGGDITKLLYAGPGEISFPADLDELENMIRENGVKLVILDPLESYVEGSITNRRAMRQVLDPLNRLAQKYGIAIVGIRHLTKSTSTRSICRGAGSMAITAAARSELLATPSPDNPTDLVLTHVKSNLGPLSKSILFRLIPSGESAAVECIGYSELSAEEALDTPPARERQEFDEALRVLFSVLGDGRVLAKDVMTIAGQAGVSRGTMRRAKRALGVTSVRIGFGRGASFYWELPDRDDPRVARHWDGEIDSISDQLFHGGNSIVPPKDPISNDDEEHNWENPPHPDDGTPEEPV